MLLASFDINVANAFIDCASGVLSLKLDMGVPSGSIPNASKNSALVIFFLSLYGVSPAPKDIRSPFS